MVSHTCVKCRVPQNRWPVSLRTEMRQHLKCKGRPYPRTAVSRQSSTGLTAIPGIKRGEGFRTQFLASYIANSILCLRVHHKAYASSTSRCAARRKRAPKGFVIIKGSQDCFEAHGNSCLHRLPSKVSLPSLKTCSPSPISNKRVNNQAFPCMRRREL